MSECGAVGVAAKMAVQGGSSPRTFSDASERIPFIMEDISELHQWGGREHGVGEIDVSAAAIRKTQNYVYGAFKVPASPQEIQRWFPRSIWGATSPGYAASSYTFDILVGRDNGVFRYHDCVVTKLVVTSATDPVQHVSLEVHVVGTHETQSAWMSPEPAIGNGLANSQYMHHEVEILIGSTGMLPDKWALTVDNRMRPAGYNSVGVAKYRSRGRKVRLQISGGFTVDTLSEAIDIVSSPADCSITLTHSLGAMSCVIELPNMRNTGWISPSAASPGNIPLILSATPGNSTGNTLTFTNDITP